MAIETRKSQYVRTGNVIINGATQGDYIDIFVIETMPNGQPINYITTNRGMLNREKYEEGKEGVPFLRVSHFDQRGLLPDLVDALLAFGILPKEHALDTQERTAIEKHLEDMRKIVAKQLGGNLDAIAKVV